MNSREKIAKLEIVLPGLGVYHLADDFIDQILSILASDGGLLTLEKAKDEVLKYHCSPETTREDITITDVEWTLIKAQHLKSTARKAMEDRPERGKRAKEIVLEIRQYLCNTEFAPEPFTEPVDPDKLTIEFPKQILALFPSEEQVRKEAKREERERIATWRLELCPHGEVYVKRDCDICWQALKGEG